MGATELCYRPAGVTREDVYSLWLIMIALGGVFGGVVSGQIVSAAFYAAGDTKTPTKVSAIVYTIYLPFKIIIFLRYGAVGLGITVSAYCLTNFLVQFVMLERDVARKLKNHWIINAQSSMSNVQCPMSG